jgi:hypothetical protein
VLGWNWHNKVSGEDLIILNTGSPDDDEQAAKLWVRREVQRELGVGCGGHKFSCTLRMQDSCEAGL